MQIIVFNGTPSSSFPEFDNYMADLYKALQAKHTLHIVTLRDLAVQPCTGCRSCWVKTPGYCQFSDAISATYSTYLGSDLAVFCSPILMGFTSALLKQAAERLIPLLHPHFQVRDGELGHKARYDRHPKMGLLLGMTKQSDKDDVKIITDIYRRMAVYFQTNLAFSKTTSDPAKEVIHAFNSI